jgi:methyltransferase-like protein 23
VQILGLNWGEWDSNIFDLHPKIILGADVLYDTTGSVHTFHFAPFCMLLNQERVDYFFNGFCFFYNEIVDFTK